MQTPNFSAAEDVAVIGMACRFPGAPSIDAFEKVLLKGDSQITDVPRDRWDVAEFHSDSRTDINRTVSRWGGFLEDVAGFDSGFFGVSAQEVGWMDPQQRLALTLAWECLEDAGYAAGSLEGSRTGVYIGVMNHDYAERLLKFRPEIEGHLSTGTHASIIPNRISWHFDLRGPSVAVDTACSGSLVALHNAVRALRQGECDTALAGGVSLLCSPTHYISFSKMGMLSRDGLCRTFDEQANGYVRGEGAGLLLLKPLQRAIESGDRVVGVIRGSAVNHGGRARTLTYPNADAQASVIADAMRDARVDASALTYVEAHGTGTPKGDPIEVEGLRRAFAASARPDLAREHRCALGSVKTQIGHLEAAAGIAGVIKVLICMRTGILPGLTHYGSMNPRIDLTGTPFYMLDRTTPWTRERDGDGLAKPLCAGVSSFGFGGVNAHVVIEEYLSPIPASSCDGSNDPAVIVLSARDEHALRARAAQLADWLRCGRVDDESLHDVAYTLQVGRDPMRCRLAVVTRSTYALCDVLDQHAQGHAVAEGWYGEVAGNVRSKDSAGERAAPAMSDLASVAQAWVSGHDVDWSSLYPRRKPRRIGLPTYPFASRVFWVGPQDCTQTPEPVDSPVLDAERDVVDRKLSGYGYSSAASADIHVLRPAWHVIRDSNAWTEDLDRGNVLVIGSDAVIVRESGEDLRLWSLSPGPALADLAGTLAANTEITRVIWDPPQHADPQVFDIRRAQANGVLFCFSLIKALLAAGYESRPLEWVVFTRGCYRVDAADAVVPTHAGVHGLMASLSREYPHWTIRLVDLEAGVPLPMHLPRMDDPMSTSILASRKGNWHVRRFEKVQLAERSEPGFRMHGTYVLIGGAGGIGRVLTDHLVKRYRAKVVWIGRRSINEDIAGAIAAYADQGFEEPVYIRADATDVEALRSARDAITNRFGAIHGVVHTAITLSDRMLWNMDEASFSNVYMTKALIALGIAETFRDVDLDVVLFFSSVLSLTGAAGQANYVAGCAFKDALATWISDRLGCPAKVVNWGYWGSVGIVASESYRAMVARSGLTSVSPDLAMQFLEAFVRSPEVQLVHVASDNVSRLGLPMAAHRDDRTTSRNTMAELLASVADYARSRQPAAPHAFAIGDRSIRPVTLEELRSEVARIGGLEIADVDPDASWDALGLDVRSIDMLAGYLTETCARRISVRDIAAAVSPRQLYQLVGGASDKASPINDKN